MSDNLTWIVVARFDAPPEFNDDSLLNAFASAVEELGGESEDSIIGNLSGPANGSLDDAFDAARGHLQAAKR